MSEWPSYILHMVKRTLLACAVLVGVLGMPAMAMAAPPAMTLSSWVVTSLDGVITGGTRTVTVTNTLDEPIEGLSVRLDPTPCDCDIISASTDGGTIDGFNWNVGTLQPGETKTLTLGYGTKTSTSFTAWLPNPIEVGFLLLAALTLGATMVVVRRQDRLGGWSFSG